jgi:hypothetical protein
VDTHNGGLENKNGVYRPVVADFHHFKEDPDPHLSEKLDPNQHKKDKDLQL